MLKVARMEKMSNYTENIIILSAVFVPTIG